MLKRGFDSFISLPQKQQTEIVKRQSLCYNKKHRLPFVIERQFFLVEGGILWYDIILYTCGKDGKA
mgnify:CR=1 FL=1